MGEILSTVCWGCWFNYQFIQQVSLYSLRMFQDDSNGPNLLVNQSEKMLLLQIHLNFSVFISQHILGIDVYTTTVCVHYKQNSC